MSTPAPPVAFATHDHHDCVAGLLTRAEGLCERNGSRLTPVRRRVLEILAESHRALGAYDVLDRLSKDGFGNQPPVAYRALDFLVEQGLAHRIARLNAFMACTHAGESHNPSFFICRTCNAVAEAPATPIRAVVNEAAAAIGFSAERIAVEVTGLCPGCRDGD